MEEKTVIETAEQTTAKLTIIRGRTPKSEITVKSICNVGDEKKMIKRLIDFHKDLLKELSKIQESEGGE